MNKKTIREKWMYAFEANILRVVPHLSGKLNWNAAAHYYNIGLEPYDAAMRYLKTIEHHSADIGLTD